MSLRRMLLCSAFVAASMAAGGQAMAQAAPAPEAPTTVSASSGLGEVVVTARRRSESLQKVPTSIVAFSQKTLTEKSITSAFDLAKAVPGLTVDADSGNTGLVDFSIRGRGTNFGAAAGSVEAYFAEIPLSPPFQMPTLPAQFFDLQSFQVLKGPQGTLFGRTTTGGAVLMVPQAPTDQFGGYLRLQGGTYNDFQAEGAINVPLVGDKVLLRLAGFDWQRAGYMTALANYPNAPGVPPNLVGTPILDDVTRNPLGKQTYANQNESEFRATLLVRPVEGLTNSTLFTYHTDNVRNSTGSGLNQGPPFGPAMGTPIGNGIFKSPGYGTYDTYTNVNLTRPGSDQAYAVINTTTYDLTKNLTLKNIFGYINASGYTDDASDSDGLAGVTTIDLPAGDRPRKNQQTTDEVQLQGHGFLDDRLSFVVGGLLDQTREPGNQNDISIFTVNIDGAGKWATRWEQNTVNSYSLFGSATFKITDKFSVSAGYRHSWDDIQLVVANEEGVAPGAGLPPFVPNDTTWQNRVIDNPNNNYQQGDSYNFDAEYHPTRDLMVYGGYRRGYKHGGYNASALTADTAGFGPETVDDFYFGVKDQFNVMGMPGRINVEGYYDLYHGMQNAFLSFAGQSLTVVVVNVPETTFRGFDAELALEPTKWLSMDLGYSLIDAFNTKWSDTGPNPADGFNIDTQSLTSNPVAYTSKNKVNFSARFHTELPDDRGELALIPSVTYQDRFYTTAFATVMPYSSQVIFGNFNQIAHGGAFVPGYSTVDLRAEWNHIMGSRIDGAVNVTNLTNQLYFLGNSSTLEAGVQGNAYGPPRMITIDLSTKF